MSNYEQTNGASIASDMARSKNGKWDASIVFTGTLWNGKTVPGAIKRAMDDLPGIAYPILERNSPVKTGYLKTHWKVSTGDRTLSIVNPAFYGSFVDLGTRRISPRRFVQRSLDEIESEFKDRATRYITEGLSEGQTPRKNQREALSRLTKGIISPNRRPVIKYW